MCVLDGERAEHRLGTSVSCCGTRLALQQLLNLLFSSLGIMTFCTTCHVCRVVQQSGSDLPGMCLRACGVQLHHCPPDPQALWVNDGLVA